MVKVDFDIWEFTVYKQSNFAKNTVLHIITCISINILKLKWLYYFWEWEIQFNINFLSSHYGGKYASQVIPNTNLLNESVILSDKE